MEKDLDWDNFKSCLKHITDKFDHGCTVQMSEGELEVIGFKADADDLTDGEEQFAANHYRTLHFTCPEDNLEEMISLI